MPFTATIAPSRSARPAASTASRARSSANDPPPAYASRTRGPQSGQAFGWAWKRLSAGSSYSARQAGHMSKPAIVVCGRSYGTSRTIVKRGPQAVQFVNG